jgi:hypothetical protein
MGGLTPLGYAIKDRKLVAVPEEAETVRLIFRRYRELGSVRLLKQDLDQQGIRSKQRIYGNGSRAGGQPFSRGARGEALAAVVDRIELSPIRLRVILSAAALVPSTREAIDPQEAVLLRDVPLRIKRRGVEMRLVIEGRSASPTNPDPVLLKEIRRAHRCFEALVSGQVGSVAELATLEEISDRYVSSVLPLAFLAPDIVEAIAAGRQPSDLTAHRLIRAVDLPIAWSAQKQLLGFPAASR